MRANHPGMQIVNDEFISQVENGSNKMPLRVDLNGVEKNLALSSPEPGSLESWEMETRILQIFAATESDEEEEDVQYFTMPDFGKEFEEDEEKFAKLRKALTNSRTQQNRYDSLVSCFEWNSDTRVYCLHNFSVAELCAAITGIRRSSLRDDVQKRIWINPSLTCPIPLPPRKGIQDDQPIEIDVGDLSKTWKNIIAQFPSVKLASGLSKARQLKQSETLDPRLTEKLAEIAEHSRKRTSLLPPKDPQNKAKQEQLKNFSSLFRQLSTAFETEKLTRPELPQLNVRETERLQTPRPPKKQEGEKPKTPRIYSSRTSLLTKRHQEPKPEDLSDLKPTVTRILPKLGKK